MPNRHPLILLNDNIHAPQMQRGVDRCFVHVVSAAGDRFGRDALLLSPRADVFEAPVSRRRLPAPLARRRRLQSVATSVAALLQRARLVYSPYFGRLHTRSVEVYAVYDMIYELFPQHFPPSDPTIARFVAEKRRCFERATAIVAISEATARDVTRVHPHVDPARIHVIYPGVDERFLDVPPSQVNPNGNPYFLYVGNRWLYKNFLRLLEAFGQSGLARDWDLRVVSPIEYPWTEAERSLLERFGLLSRVKLLNDVGDQTLRGLYASATAFLYPSEYEGFGLPVLEAMASGTLVAAARAASIPEAGGDVALYFDPLQTEEIVDCLRLIARMSDAERKARIDAGLVRARTFSWKQFRDQTADLLASTLAG